MVSVQLGSASVPLDLQHRRVLLGRDATCGLVSQDPSLSRRHAEIFLDEGRVWLRDLGSSSGTWVNGQLLGQLPVALEPGQQIYVGEQPLGVVWQPGGATAMARMPPPLLAMIELRKAQLAAGGVGVAQLPGTAAGSGPPVAPAAPLPDELGYRCQAANGNGVLVVALRGDTFANGQLLDGFLELTCTDSETVASIFIDLIEVHQQGPAGGHVWDRMLVRQGPWRAAQGDVLALPFQLRTPAETAISGREVAWELRAYVDINWAVDLAVSCPVTMRNTDLERVRDALGGLDYRLASLESRPLGQRFTATLQPPAALGLADLGLAVEYLGASLKVSLSTRERQKEQVLDLARFRAAPLAELSASFKAQVEAVIAAT
jgi:hypothetical protein